MKILFIGNSYTEYNSLHLMFASMCKTFGIDVETHIATEDGMTLQWHYYEESTQKAIGLKDWDYVVLQEQSIMPLEDPIKMLNSIRRFSNRLVGTNTQIALYSTWARKFLPEVQHEIDKAYADAATDINAVLLPVGKAWSIALTKHENLELYTEDQSHPSLLGSYLAACVIFSKLTGISAEKCEASVSINENVQVCIKADTAKALQACAEEAVKSTSN